ncbi:uncharacterized protein J3D65DRAFT_310645 [Phyllosticta citribraziliensis]|uniref:Uncharacterized protein n=1 Tax=Phyllosticta citribraziliensis TaxID=989973 RepID=A0ABR1LZS7_9PEZI
MVPRNVWRRTRDFEHGAGSSLLIQSETVAGLCCTNVDDALNKAAVGARIVSRESKGKMNVRCKRCDERAALSVSSWRKGLILRGLYSQLTRCFSRRRSRDAGTDAAQRTAEPTAFTSSRASSFLHPSASTRCHADSIASSPFAPPHDASPKLTRWLHPKLRRRRRTDARATPREYQNPCEQPFPSCSQGSRTSRRSAFPGQLNRVAPGGSLAKNIVQDAQCDEDQSNTESEEQENQPSDDERSQ